MLGRKLSVALGLTIGLVVAPAVAAAQAKSATKAATKAPASKKGAAAKPAAPTRLRFVIAPEGNEARYRVREQLAGVDLPSDAVGVTKGVSGQILVESDGR